MKRYIKTAIETLEALDCRLDHRDRELRTDRWRFTHPHAPDEFFTINFRSSETACRAVVQRAKVAAGLATSETGKPKPAPNVNARQKAERAAERQRIEAARREADARAAAEDARRLVTKRQQQISELDRLIRGRDDSAPAGDISPDAMLTVEQVADQTGLTDRAVRHAINSGALEPYQCGRVVKVKGADVRAWLRTA